MNKKNVFTKLIRGAKYRQIIKSRANRVIEPVFYGASALRAMYRNLDMATVTEFSSPTATDYSMSYGDKKIAKMGGHTAKVARDELEKNLGENVVSKDNALSYKYVEDDLMIENKE